MNDYKDMTLEHLFSLLGDEELKLDELSKSVSQARSREMDAINCVNRIRCEIAGRVTERLRERRTASIDGYTLVKS